MVEQRLFGPKIFTTEYYIPAPVDTRSTKLLEYLLSLAEEIAKNVHEVWTQGGNRYFWTYGPVRNDDLKQHPDLVPYAQLPDSDKEYDRLMAMNTLRLGRRLGFDITHV